MTLSSAAIGASFTRQSKGHAHTEKHRVDWWYFCTCHSKCDCCGKCDCDPDGRAAKHAAAQQQLRDNTDERTRISTYNDLINF